MLPRPAPESPRRFRWTRPGVETLEGRALLSGISIIGPIQSTRAIAQDGPSGPVGQTTYHSILGDTLTMNIWQGTHVSILTDPSRTDLDPSVMAKILDAFDRAYVAYAEITGAEPNPFPPDHTIDGRDAIAVVDRTGGAGYSYLGAMGMEIMTPYFQTLYDGVRQSNQYDQVAFYEFGRNFWTFGDQLNGQSIGSKSFTTGFAVLNRFVSMDRIGLTGAPYNAWSFAEFESHIKALVDQYVADTSLNFGNTLAVGQGVPNSQLGSTDLFASFLFRLARDYGGDAYFSRLWREVAQRPKVTTDQGAIDNLFIAASRAAGRDLGGLFADSWRWPISRAARDEAASLPKPTVSVVSLQTPTIRLRTISGGKVKITRVKVIQVRFSGDVLGAGKLAAYQLRRGGTRKGVTTFRKRLPLASASYDPSGQVVTLIPRKKLDTTVPERLTILGGRITDASGLPIQGGLDVVITFGRKVARAASR